MRTPAISSHGSALLEVLVTIVILAFGLLGVAGLQSRMHVMEYESYQRAQAVVILTDIAERVAGNLGAAATYAAASPLGTGHATRASCTSSSEAKDICDLDNLLLGSGEKVGSTAVGAMGSARACITAFTSTTKIFNRCQTGVQIDIAWQGRSPTIIPAAACGSGSYGGSDAYRRVVSTRVGTGDVAC